MVGIQDIGGDSSVAIVTVRQKLICHILQVTPVSYAYTGIYEHIKRAKRTNDAKTNQIQQSLNVLLTAYNVHPSHDTHDRFI